MVCRSRDICVHDKDAVSRTKILKAVVVAYEGPIHTHNGMDKYNEPKKEEILTNMHIG